MARLSGRSLFVAASQALFMATALLTGALGGYWLFVDDSEPVHLVSQRLVAAPKANGFGALVIERRYCTAGGGAFVLGREIEGASIHELPLSTMPGVKGCATEEFTILVPPLPPGSYVYRSHVLFDRNPLRPGQLEDFPPIPFEVRAP